MQYITTTEGYPALLKTRTTRKLFSERHLWNRPSAWVYLTQNPRGRWQVLTSTNGEVTCIAGAPTAAQVLPAMTDAARAQGILKGRTRKTRSALFMLGGFMKYRTRNA